MPGDCFHGPSGEGEITARPKNVRKNITFTDGPAWLNQGPFATVAEAVQALSTSPYYQSLARAAARRLQRLAKYPPGQRLGEVAAKVFADLKSADDGNAARQVTLQSWEADWPRLEAVPRRGLNKRQRRQLREEAEARLRYEARLSGDLDADGPELLF